MFVSQVIVLFLLPYFTTSHPSHKRETKQVSISKSSQNVINDGTPVNSEPVSSSSHTAALSYHHLKEVIENSVNFLNRRSASSVIVDSSSAFHSHEKISLGKAPSDTTNLEAPTILVDGSMNRKVESHVSFTKSIKSSIKTAPIISKRFNLNSFRPSNWNWKWNNFRNWGKLKNTNPMTGAANQGLQRSQSMPNLQRTQSMPNLQRTQEFQPGQVNQNRMPSNAVKINNENKAGTSFLGGLKSRWQKLRGQAGSQASLKNNANVVQGNSPTTSSAIASDKSSVQIAPMRGASNEKNLNRPAFDSEDSQTESYSGKSTINSPKMKINLSDIESRPPETNSVNTEKIISPCGDQTRNPEEVTQIRNAQSMDQKSEPPHEKMDMLRSMDEQITNPQRWNRPPHDISMNYYEIGGREEHGGYYNGRSTWSRIAHAIENTVPLVSVLTGIATGNGNMGRGVGGYGNDYEIMDAMGGSGMGGYGSSGYGPSGYGASGFGPSGYGAGGFGPSGYGAGRFGLSGYGSTGYEASGYGASGYGAGGFGPSGYGSTGYEASGYGAGGSMGRFGASGYGSDSHGLGSHGLGSSGPGVGGGSFGANELDGSNIDGDPVDAYDPLGENRSKAVEKSTSKIIRKPKKNKNGPKTDAEIDHEGDENDTHNKSSDHTSKNIINNDKTRNKVSSGDSAKNSNNPVSR